MITKDINVLKIAIVLTIVFLFSSANVSAENKVGIIVPELRAPFKVIFDSVSNGVDSGLNRRTAKLTLKKDYDPIDIQRWIQKENVNSIITLGSLGQKAAKYVPNNIPIVHGALLSNLGKAQKFPGVALTPEPKSLFELLNRLDKTRKKVIVVYNPAKNQWVVDLAKRPAVAKGIQLVEYQATDIKQAAIIYDEILSSNDLKETALWLLQDRKVVDTKVVLPFILEKAWQKKIVVFSSAVSHVKKGVLFSMYPDNNLHGEQLAKLISSKTWEGKKIENKIYPSQGLQDAINIRTAEHLGLSLSRSDLRDFDVVFPVSN